LPHRGIAYLRCGFLFAALAEAMTSVSADWPKIIYGYSLVFVSSFSLLYSAALVGQIPQAGSSKTCNTKHQSTN